VQRTLTSSRLPDAITVAQQSYRHHTPTMRPVEAITVTTDLVNVSQQSEFNGKICQFLRIL